MVFDEYTCTTLIFSVHTSTSSDGVKTTFIFLRMDDFTTDTFQILKKPSNSPLSHILKKCPLSEIVIVAFNTQSVYI